MLLFLSIALDAIFDAVKIQLRMISKVSQQSIRVHDKSKPSCLQTLDKTTGTRFLLIYCKVSHTKSSFGREIKKRFDLREVRLRRIQL